MIVLCGFGSSFALLHSGSEVDDDAVGYGFQVVISSIWSLLLYTITGGSEGGIEYDTGGKLDESLRWFYVALDVLFHICIVVLMMNLLIAMMSATFEKLKDNAELIVLRERYNIMCSLERSFTANEKWLYRSLYCRRTLNEYEIATFFFELDEIDSTWNRKNKNSEFEDTT
jgi:hypothetical protein